MALLIQINWFDYGEYKIIDVHDKIHEGVLKFMLEHFRSYRLFQILKISQEPDIEQEFLKLVKHILQDESSLVVVDKENNIKGVALLKCMTQEWRSWTCLHLLIENDRFMELYAVVSWCRQQQALKHPENPGGDSLHIFSFHLCEELSEDQEFLSYFFKAINEVARHMHLPRVTYLSLSRQDSECMESKGFKEMVRIIYSMYVFKGRRPFDRLRDINELYGGFYENKVEALVPYQDIVIRHVKEKEVKGGVKKFKEEDKKDKNDKQKEQEND